MLLIVDRPVRSDRPIPPAANRLPRLPRERRRKARSGGGETVFRRAPIAASILLFTFTLIGVLLFAYAWNTIALPPDSVLSETTMVTDADGKTIAEFNA